MMNSTDPIDTDKLSDRELLMVVYTNQLHIMSGMDKHSERHDTYTKIVVSVGLTGVVTLVVGFALLLFRFGIIN